MVTIPIDTLISRDSIETRNNEILENIKSHIENLKEEEPYHFRCANPYIEKQMPWNYPIQFSANQSFDTIGMLNQNDYESHSFQFFHRDKQKYLDKIEEL